MVYILIFMFIFIFLFRQKAAASEKPTYKQPSLKAKNVAIIERDGYQFKDLNQNGKLDKYEDWRLPADIRAKDLACKMSIAEIAGFMLYSSHQAIPEKGGMFPITYEGKPYEESNARPWEISDQQQDFIIKDNLRHILITSVKSPEVAAKWNNEVQALAENIGLGIPINISSDPRHGAFADAEFNAGAGGNISLWPEGIGLAATFNPELVKQFGQIAAKEYRALGITTALSPQVDLATEPRWLRANGTFGEDPDLATDMARAYVDGFQTSPPEKEIKDGWGFASVNAMIKHWPGGGAEEGGRDGHFDYGKYTVYPGENFPTHLKPFTEGGFNLEGPTKKAAAVMPYYTIPFNQSPFSKNVANAYSNYIITTLLRGIYQYDGVVCTDWGITDDRGPEGGFDGGRPWGLEDIAVGKDVADVVPSDQINNEAAGRIIERHYRIIMAGVDQFGGNNEAWPIIAAYKLGCKRIGQKSMRIRFEQSAVRLLKNIFRTGLFENPYLEPATSQKTVGSPEYVAKGFATQQKSIVCLKNGRNREKESNILPLTEKTKVYIPDSYQPATDGWGPFPGKSEKWYEPLDDKLINKYCQRVDKPEDADVAIVFVQGPMPGNGEDNEDPLHSYKPISLQYKPYTPEIVHTTTGRSYSGKSITTDNEKELSLILETAAIMKGKPIIVSMSLSNPAVVNEFEHKIDALVVNFGSSNQAILDIIFGKVEPSGLLPFQMPANMKTVEEQLEDVERDMTCHVDEAGYIYDFAFGLNWDGQIKDERYHKYY